mgnify:CR=1 FL=1
MEGHFVIDFHTHLDLYKDPFAVAQMANVKNEFTLCMTTSPRAWLGTSQIFKLLSKVVVALGMHPEIVGRKQNEMVELFEGIQRCRFIGEVGLDGSTQYKSTRQLQKCVFERIVQECSRLGGRIVSVHSRRAIKDVLDVLERVGKSVTVILHWFSGSQDQLNRAISLGCFFSVNPLMLFSRFGRELFPNIPKDRLLLESDGPFAMYNATAIMPWEPLNVLKQIAASVGCLNLVAGLEEDVGVDFLRAIAV